MTTFAYVLIVAIPMLPSPRSFPASRFDRPHQSRRIRAVLFLGLTAGWLAPAELGSQDSLRTRLLAGLQPGPRAVGFRRLELPARTAGPGRLAIDVWYPAARAGATPVSVGAYVALSARAGLDTVRLDRRAALASAMTGSDTAIGAAELDAVLAATLLASHAAPPGSGRHPLAVWSPRYETVLAQALLSEWLASHGTVVAVPHALDEHVATPFEAGGGDAAARALAAHAADLSQALAHLRTRAEIDATRIALLAWSYGGEAAARVAREREDVRMIVGLSTNILQGFAYVPSDTVRAGESRRADVTWVVLTEERDRAGQPRPRPGALDRVAGRWALVTFRHLGHGNFNALEGAWPAWLGARVVHPWVRAERSREGWPHVAAAVRLALASLASAPGDRAPCLTSAPWSASLGREGRVELGSPAGCPAPSR